jgi:glycosyltransferase involved in cell wall biosynthesis
MDASIIICTYNRSQLLERVLAALTKQTVPAKDFEVIVVDDGSRDETARICHRMQALLPNFKCISLKENIGTALARNKGVEAAEADYILFIDDDCIPAVDWIENSCIAMKKSAIVAGAVTSVPSPYLLLCHNIAEFHGVMPGRKKTYVDFLAGANMGYHRLILDSLGGFEAHSKNAEDMDIVLRARSRGHLILFAPDARVTHDPPNRDSLASIIHYSIEHAKTTILLRNQYRRLLHTPIILRSSLLILLFSPIIASAVTLKMYCCNRSVMKLPWTMPVVFFLKLSWCWGAARGLRSIDK